MQNRAAIAARRILKRAYGGPVLLFDRRGSFVKLLVEGETVQAGGDLAAAVDGIYGDRMPGTITLRSGAGPEHPGQGRLFDTGEDDERFKAVRERPEPHTAVLSVEDAGAGVRLTVVSSDYAASKSDEFIVSVIDELREMEVYPPWESGEGLAESVDASLGRGGDIPSEFYEDRYNWDELVEPHNESWATQFEDDVRRAIEELLDDGGASIHGASFPAGESIGDVVAALAAGGVLSVMSPDEVAKKLSDTSEFRHYEEQGHDEIAAPIVEEIRETWKARRMMRRDDEKFDAMREALDAPVDMPPNSDAVLRMIGAFKDNGWDAMSFRELAKEMPSVARQERFWKAVAKGSPKLTPDRMQAYLDGKNPKAAEALPKSFGGKAVNPPKYRMVAEEDYEGYTIANFDEHMLGVAALYVEDMNEDDAAGPAQAPEGWTPSSAKSLITDAMRKWSSSAHPLSDTRRGVGWIRYDLVDDDDGKSVMFIQEIQSDFMWAVELAAAGRTPSLGGGFPDSWEVIVPGGGFEKKLAQYILKKFQGWDHYLLGNLITTARRNGVDKVVMNTSKTIGLNPAAAPRAQKKLRRYDELAKDFGFRQERDKIYGHDKEFHSRAAGRMAYHAARRIVAAPRLTRFAACAPRTDRTGTAGRTTAPHPPGS